MNCIARVHAVWAAVAFLMLPAQLLVGAGSPDGVLTHSIPDPLVDFKGRRIETAARWLETHRPQLLATFEREIYGVTPDVDLKMNAEVWDDTIIDEGRTRRKQVRLTFRSDYGSATAEMLIYAPAGVSGPVPVFLGLNTGGNLTITHDPDVPGKGRRGRHERRWPVEFVTGAGYAVATLGCDDFFPDKDMASFAGSIQRLFPPETRGPGPNQWGAIATWAWGLSRALDYLASDPQFDAARVAVIGHSRLGKAALWAGARDTRFALVVSNNSGCGGAALSKRLVGETVAAINTLFPYWFSVNFRRYNHREEELPVDQHQLLALVAPRALAVASAGADSWADPVGERLALELAGPVFALFGIPPLAASVDGAGPRRLHYHLRPGEHDILLADWEEYVRFADEVFGRSR